MSTLDPIRRRFHLRGAGAVVGSAESQSLCARHVEAQAPMGRYALPRVPRLDADYFSEI